MAPKVRKLLMIILALVILACAVWKIALIIDEKTQQQKEEEIRNTLKPGASFWDHVFPSAFAEEEEVIELPPVSPDFSALLAVNRHAIGWLTAGERIDGPVVQYNNKFYLTHNLYGEEDSNGTIFMNEANTLYLRDQVWLLHAHFMKNKGMFGTLTDFIEWSYIQKYPIVTFRTIYDEADVQYVPIAAFHASMDQDKGTDYFDLMRINFENEEEFSAYLRSITRRSEWSTPVETTPEDQLLELVTCSYTLGDGRFILVCRQLRADETVEDITELIASYTQE